MKISQYKLVVEQPIRGSSLTEAAMEYLVNHEIDNGWQPLGGPVVTGGKLCQAMVKYEEIVINPRMEVHGGDAPRNKTKLTRTRHE